MAVTASSDQPKLLDQFKRAMAIWLPELPDIPIQQWYHRIPYNNVNWTGWPNKTNPYVNGAFWPLTFHLILNELKPPASGTGPGGSTRELHVQHAPSPNA